MSISEQSGQVVLPRTIRAEWARLWTLRSMWIFAAVTTIGVAGISVLLGADASSESGQSLWTAVRRVGMLAMLLLLPMAIVGTTADYGTGGIVPTLSWTPRRRFLLASRSIVMIVAVTATGLMPALVGGGLASRLAPDQPWSWSQAVDALAVLSFVYAFSVLLAVGVGLLLRSTAASIGAVFALVLVLPLLLGNLPFDWTRDVAVLLPGTSVRELLIDEGLPGLTDAGARLTLVAWGVVSFAVGAWRLVRADANG